MNGVAGGIVRPVTVVQCVRRSARRRATQDDTQGSQQPGVAGDAAEAEDVDAGAPAPQLLDPDEAWSPAESSARASDGASLYSPPEEVDRFSAGYHSYGDTDSLGSLGQLVLGREAAWTTLEDEGWDLEHTDVPP